MDARWSRRADAASPPTRRRWLAPAFTNRAWKVGGRTFCWVRPFSKADLRRFGDDPVPDGDIIGVRVADLDAKDTALGAGWPGVFTIEHFVGYAAVLVQLRVARRPDVEELINDGWAAMGGRGR